MVFCVFLFQALTSFALTETHSSGAPGNAQNSHYRSLILDLNNSSHLGSGSGSDNWKESYSFIEGPLNFGLWQDRLSVLKQVHPALPDGIYISKILILAQSPQGGSTVSLIYNKKTFGSWAVPENLTAMVLPVDRIYPSQLQELDLHVRGPIHILQIGLIWQKL